MKTFAILMMLTCTSQAALIRADIEMTLADEIWGRPTPVEMRLLVSDVDRRILASDGWIYGLQNAADNVRLDKVRGTFELRTEAPYATGHINAYNYQPDLNPDGGGRIFRRRIAFDSDQHRVAKLWETANNYHRQHWDMTFYRSETEPAIRGDANLDGSFDSNDLIQVLARGWYGLRSVNMNWIDGDFNGDSWVDSHDLVLALSEGGYSAPAAASAVPEPSTGCWVALLIAPLWRRLRG